MTKDHADAYPANSQFTINARMLRDQITSGARTVLLVLLAASALVFIIACSNVANLILARTVRREGELALRVALGASAGALRRMLLAESLLLCCAGAALGVMIAHFRQASFDLLLLGGLGFREIFVARYDLRGDGEAVRQVLGRR